MAANAGKAIVTIGGDPGPLTRALSSARAALSGFAAKTASIGAALAGAAAPVIGGIAKSLSDFTALDKFSKLADKTGESVENLSALAYAADLASVPFEQLSQAIVRMQANVAKGNLGDLGDSLQGLDVAAKLEAVADYMAQLPGDAERAAAAMQIFGGGGAELLPLLKDGAQGIAAALSDAAAVGAIVSSEDAAAATAVADAWTRLTTAARAASNAVASVFAADAAAWANDIARAGSIIRDFIKQNAELLKTVAKVAAVVGGVGAGFLAVAAAAKVAAIACGVLATAGGMVAAVVGVLTSPLVLAAAGVAGLTVALSACSATCRDFFATVQSEGVTVFGAAADQAAGAWQNAVQYLRDTWASVTQFATERLGAIWQALSGGQMTAAAELAVASLQEAFYSVAAAVLEKWVSLRYALAEIFVNVAAVVKVAFADAWDAVKVYGLEVAREFAKTFDFIGSALVEAVISPLEKAYDYIRGEGAFARDLGLSAQGGLSDQSTPWIDQQIANAKTARIGREEQAAQDLAANLEALNAAKKADLAGDDALLQWARDRKAAAAARYQAAAAELPEAPEIPDYAAAAQRRSDAALGPMSKTETRGLGLVGGAGALRVFAGQGATSAAEKTAQAAEKTAKATEKSADDLKAIRDAVENAEGGALVLV